MFLCELNQKERVAFVNLVEVFAKVDQVFEKEEKELIEDYLGEFTLEKEVIGTLNLEEIKETFKNSTERVKKIVCFELVILALVDGEYEDEEIDFLKEFAKAIGVDGRKLKLMEGYFLNFKEIYEFSTIDSESKIALLMEEAEVIINL